jgi:hypothetical protein
METALQELIAELQIEMQKAQEQDSPNIASGFLHSIVKAQAKLPKEREQMKKARENGFANGVTYERHNYVIQDFEQYYETNFNSK